MEIWKDIEGYEGDYQVSNLGRVKSYKFKKEEVAILKPHKSKREYFVVYLNKKCKRKACKIHRLVAQAFIPNPSNKELVNHIDGDKLNNNVSNLEWSTHGENVRHALKNGLIKHPKGSKNKLSKEVICITTNQVFGGIREAERITGVDGSGITKCCKGIWKHSGIINGKKAVWMYHEDYKNCGCMIRK